MASRAPQLQGCAHEGMERADLDVMVDELERHMPRMREKYPDAAGFWFWFAGEAASIGGSVRCREDWLHVRDRISEIVERLERIEPRPAQPLASATRNISAATVASR